MEHEEKLWLAYFAYDRLVKNEHQASERNICKRRAEGVEVGWCVLECFHFILMVYLDQCGLDEHWVKLREKQTTLSVGGSGEDVISGGGRTDLTVGLLPADGYT